MLQAMSRVHVRLSKDARSHPRNRHVLVEGLDGVGCGSTEANDPHVANGLSDPLVAHHRQGQVVLGIGPAAGTPNPKWP